MKNVAIALVVLVAAIAIPNLLEALNRSKQKQTMVAMRDVATAWEAWQTDAKVTGPVLGVIDLRAMKAVSANELHHRLVPKYAKALPERDGWGNTLDFAESGATYVVRSRGRDGIAEGTTYATQINKSFDDDLVYSNGTYIRYPEGL